MKLLNILFSILAHLITIGIYFSLTCSKLSDCSTCTNIIACKILQKLIACEEVVEEQMVVLGHCVTQQQQSYVQLPLSLVVKLNELRRGQYKFSHDRGSHLFLQ